MGIYHADACRSDTPAEERTIRQHLDDRIKNLRQDLEDACVRRAKAETLGILEYPISQLHDIIFG